MIEDLHIKSTMQSAEIVAKSLEGEVWITGYFNADQLSFYDKLKKWLGKYFEQSAQLLKIHFRITNDSASFIYNIVDVLLIINKRYATSKGFKVFWHYKKDDEYMLEIGEEIEFKSNVSFNFMEE